ncbi:MAG TPA: cysteine desulfurase family protein [Candidatus Paceibacterota bacterium]|nr:cysteine desulfurase family protein [Candidatus Paceibacterota bacterium]
MKLWQKNIYADAAAATPVSGEVRRELVRLLGLFGNPGGLHAEANEAKRELDAARERTAAAIGAHADEIVFTSGGTEANNLAVFGALRRMLRVGEDVHAITSAIEHSSVLEPLRALEKEGLRLTELPVDMSGFVSHKDLREALEARTVFVSIQMVNSEVGTVQDIRELAKEIRHQRKAREGVGAPLYFHTDAAQAPLWLPLNVEKLGVDLLTLDAQKMLGPKGAGLLYVRRGTRLEPHICGGGQERGLRSGTENVAMAGACALALLRAQEAAEARAEKISRVQDYLLESIQKLLPGVMLNGPKGEGRIANNINISLPNLNGDMAVVAMSAQGVAISTRSACDTDDEAPSHVLQGIGVLPERAKNTVRIALLPDATRRDARCIARTLFKVAARYAKTP